MQRKRARVIGMMFFFGAIINFIAFVIGAIIIGGDAVNGKVEGDRYFVASHGKYTEVSYDTWFYSRIHTISVFVTHPLGILVGGGLLGYADPKPDVA